MFTFYLGLVGGLLIGTICGTSYPNATGKVSPRNETIIAGTRGIFNFFARCGYASKRSPTGPLNNYGGIELGTMVRVNVRVSTTTIAHLRLINGWGGVFVLYGVVGSHCGFATWEGGSPLTLGAFGRGSYNFVLFGGALCALWVLYFTMSGTLNWKNGTFIGFVLPHYKGDNGYSSIRTIFGDSGNTMFLALFILDVLPYNFSYALIYLDPQVYGGCLLRVYFVARGLYGIDAKLNVVRI